MCIRDSKHFMHGTFSKGLSLVPNLEEKIEEYKLHIDTHRILIFYYKIACLYFGSGDNAKAIEYLNLIINRKPDLRTDLHCYSRLLHLICLLYTSDAADERSSVDLGGRRIIK